MENDVFVYCQTNEGIVADISLELLSAGRRLADKLNCKLEAVVLGHQLDSVSQQIAQYGVDVIHKADDISLDPYLTLPHSHIVTEIFRQYKPQIVLFGATTVGRDLAPRVASALSCGLTADCTVLEIGDHIDKKTKKEYKDLLLAIRPAFGGTIMATIVNWDKPPQMATVREGVLKKVIYNKSHPCEVKYIDVKSILVPEDFVVKMIDRQMEAPTVNLKEESIIISGGYGVGSKENFKLLYEFGNLIGGNVGGSRAAVDAGFIEHERQIGQTGVTVRPKLYIACGISGAIQHTAGMDESALIVSINNDPEAPINRMADYVIVGDIKEVISKMIRSYKDQTK